MAGGVGRALHWPRRSFLFVLRNSRAVRSFCSAARERLIIEFFFIPPPLLQRDVNAGDLRVATDPWARPRMRRSRSDPGARSGASLLKWLAALGRVRASLDVSAAPLKNWFATLGRRLLARSLLRQRTLGHRSCRHFAWSPRRQRTLRHLSDRPAAPANPQRTMRHPWASGLPDRPAAPADPQRTLRHPWASGVSDRPAAPADPVCDPLRPADYKSCTRQPEHRTFHAGWRGGHCPLRTCAEGALGHRRASARTRDPALPMPWRGAAWRGHEKVPADPEAPL